MRQSINAPAPTSDGGRSYTQIRTGSSKQQCAGDRPRAQCSSFYFYTVRSFETRYICGCCPRCWVDGVICHYLSNLIGLSVQVSYAFCLFFQAFSSFQFCFCWSSCRPDPVGFPLFFPCSVLLLLLLFFPSSFFFFHPSFSFFSCLGCFCSPACSLLTACGWFGWLVLHGQITFKFCFLFSCFCCMYVVCAYLHQSSVISTDTVFVVHSKSQDVGCRWVGRPVLYYCLCRTHTRTHSLFLYVFLLLFCFCFCFCLFRILSPNVFLLLTYVCCACRTQY